MKILSSAKRFSLHKETDMVTKILHAVFKVWKRGFRFEFRLSLPDARDWRFFGQKITRGFSDDELWSLDYSLAKHILPRLKRFKKFDAGRPGCFETREEWDEVLDKMIFAFEDAVTYWDSKEETKGERIQRENRAREGLKLFAKYYHALWL
jgi:hypothetical protein